LGLSISVLCLAAHKLRYSLKDSTAHYLSGREEGTGDHRKLGFTNRVNFDTSLLTVLYEGDEPDVCNVLFLWMIMQSSMQPSMVSVQHPQSAHRERERGREREREGEREQ
jgi:hypothetical protein